ncbi:MAG: hypothetical protein ACRDJY_11930, partial [Thermoleophilaceae bacterium]
MTLNILVPLSLLPWSDTSVVPLIGECDCRVDVCTSQPGRDKRGEADEAVFSKKRMKGLEP